MFGNDTAIVEQVRDEKTEKMIEYIRSLKAIEDAIEPYAEQKRELKKDFKDQGWLTKEEISMTVKAYRLMKKDTDIAQFVGIFNSLTDAARGGS